MDQTLRNPRSEGFRPDLEGLRGVAILLVLVFHAGLPGTSGGFVGVDVFFVLSGFLITGLLLRERERTGRIDLAAFYARRARRILPAAAVVLLATLALSVLILAPLDLPRVAGDAAAAALSIGNIRFALLGTEYFGADLTPSPVLHYWSLGVEEQFYLVWPALLILATRFGRPRVATAVALAGLIVASYAGSLLLTSGAPEWAFYSLPTRAWELGIGGLLAATVAWHGRLPDAVVRPLGWLGLGAIVAALVLIQPSTPYPGVAALLPALGTAAVIVAGWRSASVGAVLTLRPLRFLGLISYSLYLIHWPLLVLPLAGLAVGEELPLVVRLGLVVLAVVLAWACQRWVEAPFHRGRFTWAPARTLRLAAVAIVVTVAIPYGTGLLAGASLDSGDVAVQLPEATPDGLAGPSPDGSGAANGSLGTTTPGSPGPGDTPGASAGASVGPQRPPDGPQPLPSNVRPRLSQAEADEDALRLDHCDVGQLYVGILDCAYGDLNGSTVVAVVGDSHAAQWFPALDPIGKAHHWRMVPFVKLSCRFLDMPTYSYWLQRTYTECNEWQALVVSRLKSLRPSLVIVAFIGDRETSTAADPDPTHQGQAVARLLSGVPGPKAIIVDTPGSRFDVPVCISRHVADVRPCETPRAIAFGTNPGVVERVAAQALGATLIDLGPSVCPWDPCPVVLDGMIVYHDSHHLTATFAASLRDELDADLQQALSGPTPTP
jgi:peptidoglycan/LPS O-acetylase OafA/YrhL